MVLSRLNMVMALSLAFLLGLCPGLAYAEKTNSSVKDTLSTQSVEEPIAEGACGTCNWRIDGSGFLSIFPSSGKNGVLKAGNSESFPWLKHANVITAAEIKSGVSLNGSAKGMFENCTSLKTVDLSGLNTSQATNMAKMFYSCPSLVSVDLSGFDMSAVTDMSKMFAMKKDYWEGYASSSLRSVNLSHVNAANVTNMSSMFEGCTNLKEIDFTDFKTSELINMKAMFKGCYSLQTIDLSGFETGKVTNMSELFSMEAGVGNYKTELRKLNLSGLDTSKVKNMSQMFLGCYDISTLDLSTFNTSRVKDMSSMFEGCSYLKSIDLSGFDTAEVRDMSRMFKGCSSIDKLDISSFDTRKAKFNSSRDMYGIPWMFSGCEKLKTITVGDGWKASSARDSWRIFEGCVNLVGGNGTKYRDLGEEDAAFAQIDKPGHKGYLSYKKLANPMKVAGKTVTVKASKLKPKAMALSSSKVFKYKSKAKGKVTFKKASKGSSKRLSISKNGKVTVKKGTKKGVYKLRVKVKAAGNWAYKATSKVTTVKIRVK